MKRALPIVFALAVLAQGAVADGMQEVSVVGAKFQRDGHDWIPKGVTLVGRVAPERLTSGAYKAAHEAFGEAELADIKTFGADLIRFQVSQGANDPQSKIYDKAYLDVVKQAVTAARRSGFNVIVSLQAEAPSGLDEMGMPNAKTLRAWRRLAPSFANDRGIMLELFNEPSPEGPDRAKSHDWPTWVAAMQPLVDEIRGLGAKNVLLADGLYWAQTVKGAPEINDPTGQIAFAVHPYYSKLVFDESSWDANFGIFSDRHPVLVTEWNALSSFRNCNKGTPSYAFKFISYLNRKKIGLVAWAYDFPGALRIDHSKQLTDFFQFHCSAHDDRGAGLLISEYFHTF